VRAVLFDWDGTLADTAEASFRCYARMFEALAIPGEYPNRDSLLGSRPDVVLASLRDLIDG